MSWGGPLHPVVGMASVGVALGLLLVSVRSLAKRFAIHPELQRKTVHIGMGLCVLPFPWIFDRAWPVLVLAAISVVAMFLLRWHPSLRDGLGTVLGGVRRVSLGEVYFPIAVAVLFAISHDEWLFYVVPITILALADAVAALIGLRYGTLQYLTSEGTKSVEGSLAFFFTAFMSVLVPLLVFTEVDRVVTLLLATTIAFLVMMLESVAWQGLDNLFIPLGSYALLRSYLELSAGQLFSRLLAGVLLLVFVLFWRRRSSLDDSGLIASALFGYATLLLGGWLWMLPPLVFFLVQNVVWPRLGHPRSQNVIGVVAVSSAGLLWLFLTAATGSSWAIVPFATAFAAELSMFGHSRASRIPDLSERSRRLIGMQIGSYVLAAAIPILLVYFVSSGPSGGWTLLDLGFDLTLSLASVLIISLTFLRFMPRLYGAQSPSWAGDLAFSVLGVIASLIPCLRWFG